MVYIAQQSFGFGEVDPNIRAQYESQPYQRGCRTLSNALLSDTGSASKRWGSVHSVDIENGQKAFEFIDGYGAVFIISGRTTGYDILEGSTVIYSAAETAFSIKDACSTGNELFLLTSAGLFVHEFTKVDPDPGYTVIRSRLNTINADLITSLPETTMTWAALTGDAAGKGKLLTSGTSFFEERECGKVKYYNNGSNPPANDAYTYIARTNSEEIWKLAPPVEPDVNSVPLFTYLGKRESDTTVTTYDYYSYDIRLLDGTDAGLITDVQLDTDTLNTSTAYNWSITVRINFNGASSLTFSPTVSDGDILGMTVNTSGLAVLFTAAGGGISVEGTQDGRYSFTFLGASTSNDPGDSAHYSEFSKFATSTDISDQDSDMPSYDWIGPYKNWVNVGKVLTPATLTDAGVIEDVSWSALALGAFTTLGSVSASFDDDHEKALDLGAVGRFVLYRHGVRYKTTYFYVSDKALSVTEQGQIGTLYICAIQGNPLEAATTDDDHFTLVMQLASSDDIGTMADGRAAPRNGVTPEILVRGSDLSGSYDVQRVGMVGCPATSTAITSYTPVFTGKALTSSTSASIEVRHTAVVGDSNPIVNSQVFRVGKQEVDGGLNLAPVSGTSVGPSAYWKLTGAAINPTVPEGSGLVPSVLLIMDRIEYHQGRIFIGGFDSDIGGSNLRRLSSSQNLGITLVSTKSGSTRDFTTGALDGDGISAQISSKRGGKIVWLKSHLNTLFIGTGEEEFVIEDAPMTPTTINISSQSVYGSLTGSCAELFGSNMVFVQKDGKTIRSMGFEERRRRFESTDLLQFARHITENDTIKRIQIVGTATQRLFLLTDSGKLYCFTDMSSNGVYGWNQWSNSKYTTIEDIVSTVDASGNPGLWARTSLNDAILFNSDSSRSDYHVDGAIDYTTGITTSGVTVSSSFTGDTVSAVVTDSSGNIVYIGDGVVSGTTFTFGTAISPAPSKVVIGYPYTMTLAPNIPELMVPGKGSTLGREKNVSRLRILFNQVRGAVAAGYELKQVPATIIYDPVADAPGFYSVPVVGEYGSQPTINITQSAPYGFEISGYNAEYDFGD